MELSPELFRSLVTRLKVSRVLRGYFPRIIMVLSGGSANGFAHLGVLEVMESYGISPDAVIGTSSGALTGAVYAHYRDARKTQEHFKGVTQSETYRVFAKKYFERKPSGEKVDVFVKIVDWLKKGVSLTRILTKNSYVSEHDLKKMYDVILGSISFSGMKIPFAACASDLVAGRPRIFTSGDLVRILMASTSITGLFPVIVIDNVSYTDGGVVSNFPVNEARSVFGEGFVVGVDVSSPLPLEKHDQEWKPVDLLLRAIGMSAGNKQLEDMKKADMVFSPIQKRNHWDSFDDMEEYIGIGRKHASEKIRTLMERLLRRIGKNISLERNPFRRITAGIGFRRIAGAVLRRLSRRDVQDRP